MHENHILHCDIKAENILVDKKNHLVLADFGLARDFVLAKAELPWKATRWINQNGYMDLTFRNEAYYRSLGLDEGKDITLRTGGTPGYIPPEMWGNGGIRSYEADIWALGVTHFRLERCHGASLMTTLIGSTSPSQ